MEEYRCQICGSQISIIRTVPEQYFYIDEDGNVERDSNVDFHIGMVPSYEPICSHDRTHDIYPMLGTREYDDFHRWCDKFENECKKCLERQGIF